MASQAMDQRLTETVEIPREMRAVVYRGVDDLRLETVAVPEIGAGELLVKIATCGVCGTDLKKVHTGSHSAPRIFGHEMAGVVAKVGAGVTNFAVGDRVMVFHHVPCGACYFCRKHAPSQCEIYKKVGATAGVGAASGGGFSEYIRVMDWIVANRGVIRIPADVPFEQAAFMEPLNTCHKGIQSLHLATDETVLVVGQGPIGVMLAALAHRTGARVLTSDLYEERHELARNFGLKDAILAGDTARVKSRVLEATDGRGADVAILASAYPTAIAEAMDLIRPGGRVMLFAQTQHGEAKFDPGAVCMDEKSLVGSYSSSFEWLDEVIALVFDGYRKGFDLTKLISHRLPLEESMEAIRIASHPTATSMKIMIETAPGAGAK